MLLCLPETAPSSPDKSFPRFLLSAPPRRLAIPSPRFSLHILSGPAWRSTGPCYTLIPRTDSPLNSTSKEPPWRAAYAKLRHSTCIIARAFHFCSQKHCRSTTARHKAGRFLLNVPSWLPDPFQVSSLLHSVFYVKMSLSCLKSHRRISVTSTCANNPSRGSSSASQPPTSLPPACPLTPISPRVLTTVSSASNFHRATPQSRLQRRRRRRPPLPPVTSTKPSSLSASIPSTKTPCAALRSTSSTPSPPTSTACRSTC